jgi:hypothetical protein
MTRLLVHVEGQTEETFVNEILLDYLVSRGYISVSARIVGKARMHDRRGGIRPWPGVKRDIIRHLRGDDRCVATTMVDFYGLPHEGQGAWPGRKKAAGLPAGNKAPTVENALLDNVTTEMGSRFNSRRFVPFVVMHEFEGLLFSDCAAFSRGIGHSGLQTALQKIRDQFSTPEDINDSPTTAPSKRIKDLIPGYQKPLLGLQAALEIGLATIRRECPHFDGWLLQLESRIGN